MGKDRFELGGIMLKRSSLTWLVPLIIVFAMINAGVGLFSRGGEGPYAFTTLHGQSVEMDGRGLYQNDSLLIGAAFRGTDAVTLLVSLPLLMVSYFLYLRGSLKGQILMIGALFYMLYNGASMTFAAMFNGMFLFYTALFSASLFATIFALATFDVQTLANRISAGFPRRGIAIFMFVAGFGTLLLWLSELVGPLMSGEAPELLGPYTTMFTHGFDSAVITPAAVLTGIYLLQRKPLGYLLAAPILLLCTLIGVVVIAQTISQALVGIIFPIGVYIGMIGSWVVMGAFAIGLTIAYFRNLSNKP
jgi:hypothetical protein